MLCPTQTLEPHGPPHGAVPLLRRLAPCWRLGWLLTGRRSTHCDPIRDGLRGGVGPCRRRFIRRGRVGPGRLLRVARCQRLLVVFLHVHDGLLGESKHLVECSESDGVRRIVTPETRTFCPKPRGRRCDNAPRDWTRITVPEMPSVVGRANVVVPILETIYPCLTIRAPTALSRLFCSVFGFLRLPCIVWGSRRCRNRDGSAGLCGDLIASALPILFRWP